MKNRSPMEDQIDYVVNKISNIIKNNSATDNIDEQIELLTDFSTFLDRKALALESLKNLISTEKADEVEEAKETEWIHIDGRYDSKDGKSAVRVYHIEDGVVFFKERNVNFSPTEQMCVSEFIEKFDLTSEDS